MEIILDKKEKADVKEMTKFIKNLTLTEQEQMKFLMKGIQIGVDFASGKCNNTKSA